MEERLQLTQKSSSCTKIALFRFFFRSNPDILTRLQILLYCLCPILHQSRSISVPLGKLLLQKQEFPTFSNFRFHDLRHTAASYLAMNQTSLLEIGTLLGHKTVQMTKRYAHPSNEHIQRLSQTLNNSISTI